MTNQEVIEQFKYAIDLIKQDGKDYLDERDIPILEMAVEALENQKSIIEAFEKIKHEIQEEFKERAIQQIKEYILEERTDENHTESETAHFNHGLLLAIDIIKDMKEQEKFICPMCVDCPDNCPLDKEK